MGHTVQIPPILPGKDTVDFTRLKFVMDKLTSLRFGPYSSPTFAGLTLTSFTLINTITEFSTDGTFGGNSDSAVPTEKATKTYIGSTVSAVHAFKTITGISNDVVADATADTLTLSSADSKLTIVGTTASDTITFTVVEAQIDHDALTNFVSDEHIAHSGVTLTAGLGLNGGGTITANRTFNLSKCFLEAA